MIPVCSDILRRFRAALERDLPQRTLAPSIARTYRHVLCIESIRPPGQAGWAHHDARARPEAHDVIARGRWRAQGQLVGCSLQSRHVSAISGRKSQKMMLAPSLILHNFPSAAGRSISWRGGPSLLMGACTTWWRGGRRRRPRRRRSTSAAPFQWSRVQAAYNNSSAGRVLFLACTDDDDGREHRQPEPGCRLPVCWDQRDYMIPGARIM